MIAACPRDILDFVVARGREGTACVLVTLVGIEGNSSRSIGTQMAVAADGRRIGSFSGGCIEDAIVAEAIESLHEGWGRVVRYGVGSPYIDIRLPCGGGIDLLFTPAPDGDAISAAASALRDRNAIALRIDSDSVAFCGAAEPVDWDGHAITVAIQPQLKVNAFGQGDDLAAFALLASQFGALVHAFTPDVATQGDLGAASIVATQLTSRRAIAPVASDPWTANLFLFHGRDWEEHLLPQVLQLPGFYHGAIGSRRTHEARIAMLQEAGTSEAQIKRLRGHIGLIPATRDPATLALSILGEIVADYNALRHWTYWTGQQLAAPAGA